MNRQQALEEIGKALGVLTHQVEQENLSGMFSKNRLVEDILLPVFSILYSAPNLKNLNSTGSNTAHLDLADMTSRIGIQVTTESSAQKISKTLKGVVEDGWTRQVDRVLIFILRTNRPRFTNATKQSWAKLCGKKLKFVPEGDIVELPTLLSKISNLTFPNILKIRGMIAQSVIGEEYVDVLSLVAAVSNKHLLYEQKTARYIPGVFIETRETKQLCRSFCHPVLFLPRSVESAERMNLASWNDFLARGGWRLLDLPVLEKPYPVASLSEAEKYAEATWSSYEPLLPVIKEYKHDGSRRSPMPTATAEQLAFYEMNFHVLTNEFQWTDSTIADIREDFESGFKKVFLITGAAGQGKTNLLCDLYETFTAKHEVPCAFVSGRELGLNAHGSLSEVLRAHLFGSKFSSLEDGIARLSIEAIRLNKPFVLIIDGLNEHRDISTFSQQLELLVNDLLKYPGIRFLFSCRTEFFQDRFSNLIHGVLKNHVMVCNSTETCLEDRAREELLLVYFDYFMVDSSRVAESIGATLTRDLLLLRFFCEAYGAREKGPEYKQPDIRHFYRDELFALYLDQKLRKAALFLQTLTTTASPVSTIEQLRKVLDICLAYMLKHGQFLGVPFSKIPLELHPALYALLDEELIIRKDSSAHVPGQTSETVNFTFDELRDYLISRFLIERVYPIGGNELRGALNRFSPQNAPIEGLQRFLFYASRKPENRAFYSEYRTHQWYQFVYPREVFNIDQKYLGTADLDAIRSLLSKLDWKSTDIARNLAVRWDPASWPVLNLAVLNSWVFTNGEKVYKPLVEHAFERDNSNEMSLLEQFCELAALCAKRPDLRPKFSRYRELVRLLILCLPLHTDSWWTSPALTTLNALLPAASVEITNELVSFPGDAFPKHRRILWRALYEAMEVQRDERILHAAVQTISQLGPDGDHWLKAELERFQQRFGDKEKN